MEIHLEISIKVDTIDKALSLLEDVKEGLYAKKQVESSVHRKNGLHYTVEIGRENKDDLGFWTHSKYNQLRE